MPRLRARPELSVVVVSYDMGRELPRTLWSLSSRYQRDISGLDYEILVVDNGSPEPVNAARVADIDPRIRVHHIESALPSPARAGNVGVAMTTGRTVAVILDGARMLTPGVLATGMRALGTTPGALGRWSRTIGARRPVVTPPAWHLGPEYQWVSARDGYDADAEDALLDVINWPTDGYRLFDIGVLAGSNKGGFFGDINESGCLMLPRSLWQDVGGLDERFDLPGGGFVSLDLFARLVERDDTELVVLLGEGSFHQVHGGESTSPAQRKRKLQQWYEQYARLRGQPYELPVVRPTYYGAVPEPARKWILPEPS